MFVYRDGVLIDLNRAIEKDAGGIWPSIWGVSAINNAGQIAGTCYFGGDGAHACLLTPAAATSSTAMTAAANSAGVLRISRFR
jgi:hypothetical protein